MDREIRKKMVVEKIRDCADQVDDILEGSIYADELNDTASKIEDLVLTKKK